MGPCRGWERYLCATKSPWTNLHPNFAAWNESHLHDSTQWELGCLSPGQAYEKNALTTLLLLCLLAS